ncbi:helix-turn-helix family protein [Francisella tularensis subsp. novicida U112]|uniref:Uncharacterized protein n=1 Tax=Francisella tularensis subsp. novicida (strain ATCC 15482 / CCUG 33449 / U112) TaxID=401614 RepID=A0Q4W8_FRATN|nr:helix-turn-helix transcriptional regulator [Francisella tularensis]ABK89283.1 conserved hypothetical protein [Francisella tularensis subsp. novicida U112]AJI60259.1 helix-turn-helix family protein [Francisella tularensis subsp. novicida U112]EDX19152.1 helix-turn-helix domain protein [Francisella tularensis subsp. novicida FTE]
METKEQNRLNLFDIVKTTRISKNITQTELATKLEISKQYICDIENNRKPITIELAKEFAKVFGTVRAGFSRNDITRVTNEK